MSGFILLSSDGISRHRTHIAYSALLIVAAAVLVLARRKHGNLQSTNFLSTSNDPLSSLPDVGPRRGNKGWTSFQTRLASEMYRHNTEQQRYAFLLYGDSITETWRGTNMGQHTARADGDPQLLEKHWTRNSTGVFAISGDRTGHLLWRLRHGEMPSEGLSPKAAFVLIGTNDLGFAAHSNPGDLTQASRDAVKRLCAIVHLLKTQLRDMHVVVVALLPRGGSAAESDQWPNLFTKAIAFINEHMAQMAQNNSRVSFIDCNKLFLTSQGLSLKTGLMPDLLHPNIQGMALLSQCYQAELKRLRLT